MHVMTDARLEANRNNAQKSTGPRTPEGKAASSRNSFKHGLTGNGIVVPGEDVDRAAELSIGLHEDFRPATHYGAAMLDQAALMFTRLERSARHERAMIAHNVAKAGEEFDLAREQAVAETFARLEADPAEAFDRLIRTPEGIVRLVVEWSFLADLDRWSSDDVALARRLRGGRPDDRLRALALGSSGDFTGLDPLDGAGLDPVARREWFRDRLRERVEREILGLEAAHRSLDHHAIARDRAIASDLALFPTTPDAILARKYEAATNRALHQAMKAHRQAEATQPVAATPEPETPSEPVGSFLPEPEPAPPRPATAPASPPPIAPETSEARSKRPDPRKLKANRRRNRR